MVIGLSLLPFDVDVAADHFNSTLLLKRVNEPDAFDVAIHPKTNDRLQISLQCGQSQESYIHYGFTFKNNRWVEEKYDCFEWMWKHEEAAFGKIKTALEL